MALTSSDGGGPASATVEKIVGGIERAVMLFDACDPATFNAALGPGTCSRNGGVTFQQFLDQLGQHHSIGPWHFAPGVLTMKAGQTLVAVNTGGEAHTFTEVEDYGGGIVPVLNTLTGLTAVAPECTHLQPSDFLAPGQRSSETEDGEGVEKYQCCIHPWMRAEVRISER
jgi:plastocyanin